MPDDKSAELLCKIYEKLSPGCILAAAVSEEYLDPSSGHAKQEGMVEAAELIDWAVAWNPDTGKRFEKRMANPAAMLLGQAPKFLLSVEGGE
jgi:hypothetical protein